MSMIMIIEIIAKGWWSCQEGSGRAVDAAFIKLPQESNKSYD